MKFNGNYQIGENVKLGKNVKIGDGAVIYDNVELQDDVIVSNNCVIGEPNNDYYFNEAYQQPKTLIGPNSIIRSHSIIYSGVSTGSGFQTGHRATIRENVTFGQNCSVGTISDIQGFSTFGDYCRLHSNVHIGQRSSLGNFVFVYPYSVFTNDPTPPSEVCIGPTVGDFTQVATMTVLLPGIQIGAHALIGASSCVTQDVADYSLTAGSPAKHIKDVREIKAKETGQAHYPWPYNFDRRMPWKDKGFKAWAEQHGITTI